MNIIQVFFHSFNGWMDVEKGGFCGKRTNGKTDEFLKKPHQHT